MLRTVSRFLTSLPRLAPSLVLASAFVLTAPLSPARAERPVLSIAGPLDQGDPDLFSLSDLKALGTRTITTTTPWTGDEEPTFTGPLLRTVLAAANEAGRTLTITAQDGYSVQIPFMDTVDWDMILAIEMDGNPLDPTTYGPAWIIYPYDTNPVLITAPYQERSVWKIVRIDVE
ncbi:MAG: molybdopterin-dependent oxidoreductase [Rhodospirillum sp.]|nr:molybdopterin-dependent oxidoreductase [Rhodospirillum sp.]MCF8491978.1 molybdopterin-dependent oxidoreductase [Rhodospirillum sp.]MCF8501320.1 molybdopterin-dependent oxidoreductase [Rhodospirillum sp.]